MDLKWDYQLKKGQTPQPVLFAKRNIEGITFKFEEAKLLEVLQNKGQQLKTWGGSETTSEPHWIGVKKQTPLHIDPKYPRYTWHLVVYVDHFALRGMDKTEVPLEKNMIFLLDTHSPHQLYALDKEACYYLAVSIDSKTMLPLNEVLPKLINYANSTEINVNTDRIIK